MGEAVTLLEGIELLSGAYMDYAHPERSDATIDDIGHALSNVCRFAGHLPRFYSVAQHSCNVAAVLAEMGCSKQTQFNGLMHDTAEAFTNDLPTPLKVAFPIFKELEVKIEAAMATKFGFRYPLGAAVKYADLVMLGLEKVYVKKCLAEWTMLKGVKFEPFKPYVNLSAMTPKRAYDNFMTKYEELRP